MNGFLNQAKHNETFHECLCDKFPDSYFDWKIICLFYIAFHYLKALSVFRGKNIGIYHFEINRNIKRGKHNPIMPISDTACDNYMNLFHYSQTARYDGFDDPTLFNFLKQEDYKHALKCFDDFKKFIVSSGLKLD